MKANKYYGKNKELRKKEINFSSKKYESKTSNMQWKSSKIKQISTHSLHVII